MANSFLVLNNHFTPLPYSFACERWLFNEPEHLATQKPFSAVYTFLFLKNHVIHARFNTFLKDNCTKSPLKATFGGIESVLNIDELNEFIRLILDFLLGKGIAQIQIVSAPHIYFNQENLNIILQEMGFSVLYRDLNFHISITKQSLQRRISPAEKRRLRKCQQAGFNFGVDNLSLKDAYSFIAKARSDKTIPLNITENQLAHLFETLPNHYQLFSLCHQNKIVACCVGVRVSNKVLYVFLPASATDYQVYSPMVMLIERLYDYCQGANILFLDWGIATEHGKINQGLSRFKRNMGAFATERITWRYLCS